METIDGDFENGGPPPPSPLTGCYLLIVVGEPHSEPHKDIILQRIAKGLLSWNASDCLVDLEKELVLISEQSLEGEEARCGERLIQFASENLVTEILIHPMVSTLVQCMRNLLSSFTRHRHIIHAGYTFAANGSWALQDGTFSYTDFSEAFQEIEAQRVIQAYENGISIDLHCSPEGDWCKLPKESFAKICNVRVNPTDVLTYGSPSIKEYINYISQFLVPTSLENLLQCSDVVGNIRFSRPTLYVFPGGQGDAALFGINGFNMLLDGGFSRKACFWDFVRHLDRLDAVLMTRLNNSNIGGISSILRRKRNDAVYPQIGHFFCNIQDRKTTLSPDGDKDKDPLLIDLLDEGQEIISNLRHLSLNPQVCYRDAEPINLYHKVGHGTLNMYVLNPEKDSKEVKEFLQKWNHSDQKLFSKEHRQFSFPIQNAISIAVLLIWKPANISDTITRILYPGSTPQQKIFEGLDRIKNIEFVKHPVCSEKSLFSKFTIKKSAKNGIGEKMLSKEKLGGKRERIIVDNNITTFGGEIKESNVKKTDSTENERTRDRKAEEVKTITENNEKFKMKTRSFKMKNDSHYRRKSVENKDSPTTPKKSMDKGEAKKSATPGKSTKDANNRKVIENKTRSLKYSTESAAKLEKKNISRRPKGLTKTPISPAKQLMNGLQKLDNISKKRKIDKEGVTDSSTASTPSADQDILKKDMPNLTLEEIQQLKALELADLVEEQEAVKEIEAVFRKGEVHTDKDGMRKIKNVSIDEDKSEKDEYLIIEKEDIDTELLDEKNTKEGEIRKLTRDSEESEKQIDLISGEKIKRNENLEESKNIDETKENVIIVNKETIISSQEEKVEAHSIDKKSDKEIEEIKEVAESQPDEKISANIKSGDTTTAPTLPEDERIPLDDIKEDNGYPIEEKYAREETKEKGLPLIQLPPKAFDSVTQISGVGGIRLDKQSHIRDIVKTPDEVADLPVHEEVDYEYENKTEIKTNDAIQVNIKSDNDPVLIKERVTMYKEDKENVIREPETNQSKDLAESVYIKKKDVVNEEVHSAKCIEQLPITKGTNNGKTMDDVEQLPSPKIFKESNEVTEQNLQIQTENSKKVADMEIKSIDKLNIEETAYESKDEVIADKEHEDDKYFESEIRETEAKNEVCDTTEMREDETKIKKMPEAKKEITEEVIKESNEMLEEQIMHKEAEIEEYNHENIDEIITSTKNEKSMSDEGSKDDIKEDEKIVIESSKKMDLQKGYKKENEDFEIEGKSVSSFKAEETELTKQSNEQYEKREQKPCQLEKVIAEDESTVKGDKIHLEEVEDKLLEIKTAGQQVTEEESLKTNNVESFYDKKEDILDLDMGRKSPKDREEDVIKIVASVAEVLKSEAPLEEFEGKLPVGFDTCKAAYITELRETHITTMESPEESVDIKTSILSIPEESPTTSIENDEKDTNDFEVNKIIKLSSEDASSTKITCDEKKDDIEDQGIVQRMLVTTSSEDGGEEIEICPVGTIMFSKSSESSGRSSPEKSQESKKSSVIDTISDSVNTVKQVLEQQLNIGGIDIGDINSGIDCQITSEMHITKMPTEDKTPQPVNDQEFLEKDVESKVKFEAQDVVESTNENINGIHKEKLAVDISKVTLPKNILENKEESKETEITEEDLKSTIIDRDTAADITEKNFTDDKKSESVKLSQEATEDEKSKKKISNLYENITDNTDKDELTVTTSKELLANKKDNIIENITVEPGIHEETVVESLKPKSYTPDHSIDLSDNIPVKDIYLENSADRLMLQIDDTVDKISKIEDENKIEPIIDFSSFKELTHEFKSLEQKIVRSENEDKCVTPVSHSPTIRKDGILSEKNGATAQISDSAEINLNSDTTAKNKIIEENIPSYPIHQEKFESGAQKEIDDCNLLESSPKVDKEDERNDSMKMDNKEINESDILKSDILPNEKDFFSVESSLKIESEKCVFIPESVSKTCFTKEISDKDENIGIKDKHEDERKISNILQDSPKKETFKDVLQDTKPIKVINGANLTAAVDILDKPSSTQQQSILSNLIISSQEENKDICSVETSVRDPQREPTNELDNVKIKSYEAGDNITKNEALEELEDLKKDRCAGVSSTEETCKTSSEGFVLVENQPLPTDKQLELKLLEDKCDIVSDMSKSLTLDNNFPDELKSERLLHSSETKHSVSDKLVDIKTGLEEITADLSHHSKCEAPCSENKTSMTLEDETEQENQVSCNKCEQYQDDNQNIENKNEKDFVQTSASIQPDTIEDNDLLFHETHIASVSDPTVPLDLDTIKPRTANIQKGKENDECLMSGNDNLDSAILNNINTVYEDSCAMIKSKHDNYLMTESFYGALPDDPSVELGTTQLDTSYLFEITKAKYTSQPEVKQIDSKCGSDSKEKNDTILINTTIATDSSLTGEEQINYIESLDQHMEFPAPSTYLYQFTEAKFNSPVSRENLEDKNTHFDTHKNYMRTYLYEITKAENSMKSTRSNETETSNSRNIELPPDDSDPISSWGKPLGLPSPAPSIDNKGTPKKEKKLPLNVTVKNKWNDDKRRSESPSKNKNKKICPIYVDLTYVPHHGNSYYSYVDFFKIIRARYYVFSGIEPSREVYDALLEAKQTWDDKELEVTIIPTYDTDVLGYWVAENEELLTKCKIDLSPSASRCTINLQDHETSCSAYRLEF